ncbi:MAG: RNA polymerase factor sigma-54, partial [Deltaproteobacteria bacterium]
KKLIQEIIAEEDPRAPYSDQRIVEILKARYGLEIARRTVAKYREGLAIPSSKERRRTW